jgi:hypothetical protein
MANQIAARALGGSPAVPVGVELSLQFGTQPGQRVVTYNGTSVTIGAINGLTDYDASICNFHKRAGLGDSSGVSFESSAYPGQYLRRSSYSVQLSGGGLFDFGFNDDATFYPDSNQRYQSRSLPGYYIRLSGFQIIMSLIDPIGDPASLSETLITEQDPLTLGLVIWGAATYTVQGDDWVFEADGACTGLTPWFGSPNTSQVAVLFFYGAPPPWGIQRVVQVSVSSSTFYGLYPIIRTYQRAANNPSGSIYKIVPASQVCVF